MRFRNLLIVFAAAGLTYWIKPWSNQVSTGTPYPQRVAGGSYVLPSSTDDSGLQLSIDDPASIWVVVNKLRPIDLEYVPPDLVDVDVAKRRNISPSEQQLRSEVAEQLERMFLDASSAGHQLELSSGYRSSFLQTLAYEGYVKTFGKQEAELFSAPPGTSEHQTGLSVDVSSGEDCYIEACFGAQPAGLWVQQHGYRYGFIVRYMEGKESITGFQYEPWHLRYVGLDLAAVIHDRQATMEEVFDLEPVGLPE